MKNCLLAHRAVSVLRSTAVKGNTSPSQKSFLKLVAASVSQRCCSSLTHGCTSVEELTLLALISNSELTGDTLF